MRPESWDKAGLDTKRGLAVVSAMSLAFFAAVLAACLVLRAGPASFALAAVAAVGAAYLVSTYPKRMIGLATFRQTLDAPSFAASANIYLLSTSRARALITLRAEEPLLSRFLKDVRRRVLLGFDASTATKGADPQRHVFSESAKSVVSSLAGAERARVEEGSEELEGILSSGTLEDETKLPVFIAVSFFLPIMLMLFASMAKQTSPAAIAALLVVEVVALDLSLSVAGSTDGWRRGK